MANRLKADKAEKKKPANPEKFKPEKEAQVSVKQLVKDERTHKITGAVLILLAFFLFVAFASYLFTWKTDMNVVFNHGISPLFSSVKTSKFLSLLIDLKIGIFVILSAKNSAGINVLFE